MPVRKVEEGLVDLLLHVRAVLAFHGDVDVIICLAGRGLEVASLVLHCEIRADDDKEDSKSAFASDDDCPGDMIA